MTEKIVTIIKVISVFIFFSILTLLIYDISIMKPSWLLVACTAFIGYVLADFFSGFVHFLGDTFGSEDTPIVGKLFVFPFRDHHVHPTAMTEHGFFAINGLNSLVSLPPMLGMHIILTPFIKNNALAAFLFLTGFFLILGVFATNQIHKWAHMNVRPSFVTFLQNRGLILNPRHHSLHHTPPFQQYFCITTGWLNALLEKVGLFRLLERMFKPTSRVQRLP